MEVLKFWCVVRRQLWYSVAGALGGRKPACDLLSGDLSLCF